MLAALSLSPAAVYGNSSGAIIALDLLIQHPASVRAAILHEPPLVSVIARPDEVQAVIGGVIEKGMAAGGPPAAAEAFFRWAAGDANWEALGLEQQEQIRNNAQTFFGFEVPAALTLYRPDDATLAAVSLPVQVLVSEQSQPFFAEAADQLSERLGSKVARTPGTHARSWTTPQSWLATSARSWASDIARPRRRRPSEPALSRSFRDPWTILSMTSIPANCSLGT